MVKKFRKLDWVRSRTNFPNSDEKRIFPFDDTIQSLEPTKALKSEILFVDFKRFTFDIFSFIVTGPTYPLMCLIKMHLLYEAGNILKKTDDKTHLLK